MTKLALSLAFVAAVSHATTFTAASCSAADIQAKVNLTANGDTVLIPGGTCTWSGGVTVNTGITIDGQSITSISNNANSLTVNATSTTPTEIKNITFTGAYTSFNGGIKISGCDGVGASCGATVTALVRVDHTTWTDTSSTDNFIVVFGNGPTLIDHNTFNAGGASTMIANYGQGNGDTSDWTTTLVPASGTALYIEDNTFVYPALAGTFDGTLALDGYYGARSVFRHNTLNMVGVEDHGTPGQVWARWFEVYNNDFKTCPSGGGSGNLSDYITLRGGSGVIFNNTHNATCGNTGAGSITLEVECTSPGNPCASGDPYPVQYQVGRGWGTTASAQNLSPVYIWNNSSDMPVGLNTSSTQLQINRDYFVSGTQPASLKKWQQSSDTSSTTYTYTPFTYPYPTSASPLGTSPSSLSFANQNISTTSSSQTVTVSNSGASSITLNSIALSGTNSSEFGFTNVTCGTLPATLAASGSCTLHVTFSPSTAGSKVATLTVGDTGTDTSSVALSGTGVDPNAITVLQGVSCPNITLPGSCPIASSTAGSLIVVSYDSFNSAGSTPTMSSITDNVSNTYVQVPGARATNTSGNTSWNDIWYAANTTAGATSVTLTASTGQSGNVFVWEISNVTTVDVVGSLSSQTATSTPSGPAVTTTRAAEAIVSTQHPTPTNTVTGPATPWTSDSTANGMGWGHIVTSTTGTYTPTWTVATSGTWAGITVGFYGAASAPVSAVASGNVVISGVFR